MDDQNSLCQSLCWVSNQRSYSWNRIFQSGWFLLFYNFFAQDFWQNKIRNKSAAHTLNIQHYQLSKLTGTRFVGHRRAAFKCLLDTWPAMKLAFENIADPKTRQETKTKVKGLLKKLDSYRFVSCNLLLEHSRDCHTNFKAFWDGAFAPLWGAAISFWNHSKYWLLYKRKHRWWFVS